MPERIVQVVHPAPVRRRAPRERNERLLWAAVRTPVALREVSPAELGPAMMARGVATAVDLHAMDGGLWWALRRRGLHARDAEASPYLDVASFIRQVERVGVDDLQLLDVRFATAGTPLWPLTGTRLMHGGEEVPVDHLTWDGRGEAVARLRAWWESSVVACGGRVLVRTHGVLLHRRRLGGRRRASEEWNVMFGMSGQADCGRYTPVDRADEALAFERARVSPDIVPNEYLGELRMDPGMGGTVGAATVAANRIAVMSDRLADHHLLGALNVAPREGLIEESDLRPSLESLSAWAREGWSGGVSASDAPRAVAAAKDVLQALSTVRLWEGDELLARQLLDVEHFERVLVPDLHAAATPVPAAPEDEEALGGLLP